MNARHSNASNPKSRAALGAIAALFVLLGALATGCATGAQSRSSSLVDYLYPTGGGDAVAEEIPHLRLPLRVGVAFVPARGASYRSGSIARFSAGGAPDPITAQQKLDLLGRMAEHFRDEPYVQSIELIPSAYLRPAGGFQNLDQLRRLYRVDVIALVSYDQAQFSDEGLESIAYWTLVGAYVVPGQRNATHTLLDAAVLDIESRTLLFRAPGTSAVEDRATPVNQSQALRNDAAEGFDLASDDLVGNFEAALADFRVRLKERPKEVVVSNRDGSRYSGDGGLSLVVLAGLLVAGTRAFAVRQP